MILLKEGTVVDPKTGTIRQADVLIDGGIITKIASGIQPSACENAEVINCRGMYVGPGLVDVHVHFRDPGQTEKEDINSGADAARHGGFTSIVLMANTKPPVDTPEIISYIMEKGRQTGLHLYTCATITKGMQGEELNDFKLLKQAGAVGFTDDGIPILKEEIIQAAMILAEETDSVLSLHEENPAWISENGINHGKASSYFLLEGSDRKAEITMVERDAEMAAKTGATVNFQHLSTKEAVAFIRKMKKEYPECHIHAEATPHHLTLTEEALIKYQSLAKMNPPLRTEEDRRAIIDGVLDGTIDLIATDHAPHTKEEKDRSLTKAPSGIVGLETALPLVYETLVLNEKCSIMQVFCNMSFNPAKLYHLNAGYLAENGPADICVFDPNYIFTIEEFHSKSQNSPFKGRKLQGKSILTICNGRILYKREEEKA